MLATMVVQGGEIPRFLSTSICQYLQSGFENTFPTIDEVKKCTSQKEFDSCLAECEWKCEIDGLPVFVKLENKHEFINEVVKYYVIVKCQAMLDQLLEGLKYYDVSLIY